MFLHWEKKVFQEIHFRTIIRSFKSKNMTYYFIDLLMFFPLSFENKWHNFSFPHLSKIIYFKKCLPNVCQKEALNRREYHLCLYKTKKGYCWIYGPSLRLCLALLATGKWASCHVILSFCSLFALCAFTLIFFSTLHKAGHITCEEEGDLKYLIPIPSKPWGDFISTAASQVSHWDRQREKRKPIKVGP